MQNIDLSKNSLTTLSESLLIWNTTKQVKLNQNPWLCDCKISWLVTSGIGLDEYLKCASPKQQAKKLIATMKMKDFAPCQVSNRSTNHKVCNFWLWSYVLIYTNIAVKNMSC